MPIYEYQAKDAAQCCTHCAAPFEVRQGMHEAPLTACPACGHPVARIISACSIDTRVSPKTQLGDKNLKRLGFSKLVNEGDGKFRKTV